MSENDPRSAPHHAEHTVGEATVVELRGEIDIFTAPSLAARLEAFTADPHPDLVLDLPATAFIDRTASVSCAGHGTGRGPATAGCGWSPTACASGGSFARLA